MGHLLTTLNPDAAALADSGWKPAGPVLVEDATTVAEPEPLVTQPRPIPLLPSVGNIVVYHVRSGDGRNMRTKFPALVLDQNPEAGTLSLIIIVDAGDLWRQDYVPARVEPEPGWEVVQPALPAPVFHVPDGFEVSDVDLRLGGGWISPAPNPSTDQIKDLSERISFIGEKVFGGYLAPDSSIKDEMQMLSARLAILEAKRGPGRPPNPKD